MFCPCSGISLWILCWIQAFLASIPCAAIVSSYHFASIARPRGAVLYYGLRSSSIWGFPFWFMGLTVHIWTPPQQQEPDRSGTSGSKTCSRISGICCGLCGGPCRHGTCVTASPHVASGRQAAGRVIGVVLCGRNPIGHDGRSNPSQVVNQYWLWRGMRSLLAYQFGIAKLWRFSFLISWAASSNGL